MEYFPQINLLLEALSYLGRRAAGHTAEDILERLRSRGVTDLDSFRRQLQPFSALMERLEELVTISPEALPALFGNLPGFSYNTIGSASPAFLLFFPMTFFYDGDFDKLLKRMRSLSPESLANYLAISLGVADEQPGRAELAGDELTARVLALSIPAESKVAILDLYHHAERVLEEAAVYLRLTLEALALEQGTLERICEDFSAELRKTGLENFLSKTSALSSRPDLPYQIHPFLFGLDTNLSLGPPDGEGTVQLYCGIYRGTLQALLSAASGPEYEVYRAIKLLGDRTRFDILCYLRDRKAYGQELSAKFGLSRNTIHHHMSKMLAARLVCCTVDGNRVYYTVDKESVNLLMERQRSLLIGKSFGRSLSQDGER